MPSLNIDLGYFDHIKTLRLIARLGIEADIYPIRLWALAGRHYPSRGVLPIPDEELENLCGWHGKKSECVAALSEIGFIRKHPKGWVINDWAEHEGHLSALRQRAKKANKIRWDRYRLKHKNKESVKDSNKDKQGFQKQRLRKPLAVQCSAVQGSAVKDNNNFNTLGKKFVKPTPEEVKGYAVSIGFRLDGEKFVAHYESKGWLIGKTPMKNWRAAVMTWKKMADPTALIRAPEKKADPAPEELPTAEEIETSKQAAGLIRDLAKTKGMPHV